MKQLSAIFLAFLAFSLASCTVDIMVDRGAHSGYSASPSPTASASPSASPSPSPSPSADPWAGLADIASLTILSVSSASDFASSHKFELRVVPVDSEGNSIMDAKMGLAAEAVNDSKTDAVSLKLDTPPVLVAGTTSPLPYAVIIDLDSSGSMSTTDPQRSRVSAAKTLVSTLLAFRPSSVITVADFGNAATAPFTSSRILSDWSSDQTILEAAIDRTGASGGTPLYESVDELLRFLNPIMPSSDYQRMMFVLSDGAPTTTDLKPTVYTEAGTFAIPVHAVSLGEGSVTTTMAELAAQTGGIYAAAADATALMNSFKAVVVAREKGYVKISGSFPAASVPVSKAVIKLTIKSGNTNASGTIILNR